MKDNAEENYISSLRKVQHFQREKLIISYVLTLYSVMHPPYPTVKLQHPETLHVTQSVTALHCRHVVVERHASQRFLLSLLSVLLAAGKINNWCITATKWYGVWIRGGKIKITDNTHFLNSVLEWPWGYYFYLPEGLTHLLICYLMCSDTDLLPTRFMVSCCCWGCLKCTRA